ncbi:MAG: bifunctional DNA-formamidopyrimidine glycosylase/DNA-(apurinic or apyrimidinic site) lyase [Candidatus Beckwithbacteria bacterium]|nr:bifunctional DNA-formamidopyrimidine glycosylase/DNA-(apurinic or apyrimidinic site) lyase [Candidatus Beckwithbacteria bacterium]
MPELPEVETIRRQLNAVLVGQRIKGLTAFAKASAVEASVIGKKILGVRRKAKMIIIELSGGVSLLIHLKMTGQLIYNGQKNKYTRAIFELDKGKLLFNDLRRFGWIKVIKNKDLRLMINDLPPDVVDKEFTLNYLRKILKSSGQAVKIVLMDQKKMGGIGNIYANESLYCAKIDPRIPAKKVKKIKELHQYTIKVINQGIKYGGSTASDENYVNALGKGGHYQEHFLVYEREGKKCSRCGSEIKKIKLGGRGTYYCPGCQK